MHAQLDTALLSVAEKEHLLEIYSIRRYIFSGVYGGLSIMMLFSCFWAEVEDIGFVIAQLPIVLICIYIYRKRIGPLKKDVQNNIKELVPYTIMSKKYFPHTNQYFFSFDDPDYMHYEVDAIMYMQCREGETLYISRAPRSKYVFDAKGRFSLM